MSELITTEIFTDGQKNINAANMNGIVGNAKVQPDIIALKPASVTMDVADQFLVLKTDNTLAKARFDTIVNSTSSTLPLADSTKNGMLKQVSGMTTDFVDGTNNCQPVANIIPTGTVWDYAGASAPTGWLLCNGTSYPTATYPALFAVIGYTFGGSGANFNVPDARGRISVGAGAGAGLTNRALAAKGGEETHQLTLAEMPSHNHSASSSSSDSGHIHTVPLYASATTIGAGANYNLVNTISATGTSVGYAAVTTTTTIGSTGGGTAHNNMPPFVVLNRIIKP